MTKQETIPKYKVGDKVAVKEEKKRAFQIGTILKIDTVKPGQLGREPGTILYLIRVKQYIDENRKITNYEKPPFPMTTATEPEMQPVKKTKK